MSEMTYASTTPLKMPLAKGSACWKAAALEPSERMLEQATTLWWYWLGSSGARRATAPPSVPVRPPYPLSSALSRPRRYAISSKHRSTQPGITRSRGYFTPARSTPSYCSCSAIVAAVRPSSHLAASWRRSCPWRRSGMLPCRSASLLLQRAVVRRRDDVVLAHSGDVGRALAVDTARHRPTSLVGTVESSLPNRATSCTLLP